MYKVWACNSHENTISVIHKFRENILESSRNVSEIAPGPSINEVIPINIGRCTPLIQIQDQRTEQLQDESQQNRMHIPMWYMTFLLLIRIEVLWYDRTTKIR